MFAWQIREVLNRRREAEAARTEIVRQFRQIKADVAPYSPYAEALRGGIVGAPADPEAFG